MNEQEKQFIHSHLNDDVRKLALSKTPDGVDLRFVLEQIDGRQRAKTKLPSLAANPDIIFPVHLSVEQCSSETTAAYKASIIKREGLLRFGEVLIDLTGGFGIDFIALSKLFGKAIYVERNAELCAIAEQNFRTLNLTNTQIVNAEAESFLKLLTSPTLPTGEESQVKGGITSSPPMEGLVEVVFFADPARRSESGSRTYAISDCTPDILQLLPTLKAQGSLLFLKLSPMLDWHKAVEDIQAQGVNVSEVHIVSVKNECKELLLLVELQVEPRPDFRLFCVNDESILEITATVPSLSSEGERTFLLLPNASIMKAGCWNLLISRFGVTQADPNSHIFFSDHEIADFPGKQYRIQAVCTMNKKELRNALQGITHANIAVRNFPLSADALRKRLKLMDGGDTYIFGTTIQGEHKLIIAKNCKSK